MKRILTVLFVLVFPVALLAQDAASPLSPEATSFLTGLLQTALVKYPMITTLIALIGSMRVWAKPVFGILHSIVALTPTKEDDAWWAKAQTFFTTNAVGKTLAWLLDYIGSIKVVPPSSTKPTTPTT